MNRTLETLLITLGALGVLVMATCVGAGIKVYLIRQTWTVTSTRTMSGEEASAVARILEIRASRLGLPGVVPILRRDGRSFVVELHGRVPSEEDVGRALSGRGLLEWLPVERTTGDPHPLLAADEVELPDPNLSSRFLVASRATRLRSVVLEDARSSFGTDQRPVLVLRLSTASGDSFRRFARENLGRQVALVVDGELIVAPAIKAEVGHFFQVSLPRATTPARARAIAALLAGGPLPEGVRLIAHRTDSER